MRTCRGVVSVAALVIVLAGCGASPEPAAQTSTPPSQAASPPASPSTTSPAPPVGPMSWGRATFVTGTESVSVIDGELTTDPDGTVRSRGGRTTLELTADDPRVSGTMRETWDHVRWGSPSDGALVESGTAILTNDGGRWVGTFSGVYTTATSDVVSWWLVGSGGYEGLCLLRWVVGSRSGDWVGLIVPGRPPPTTVLSPTEAARLASSAPSPTSSPVPPSTAGQPIQYGPATYLSGSYALDVMDEGTVTYGPGVRSRSRGGLTVVSTWSPDPRVSGTKTETWNSDRWGSPGDGALIQWGTGSIASPGGSWVGSYSGAYTPPTSDVIMWWFVGTGDNAGMSMFRWIDGNNGTWHALVFPGTPPAVSAR